MIVSQLFAPTISRDVQRGLKRILKRLNFKILWAILGSNLLLCYQSLTGDAYSIFKGFEGFTCQQSIDRGLVR